MSPRGDGDDGDVLEVGGSFEASDKLNPVDAREADVRDNKVGRLSCCPAISGQAFVGFEGLVARHGGVVGAAPGY